MQNMHQWYVHKNGNDGFGNGGDRGDDGDYNNGYVDDSSGGSWVMVVRW